MTEKPVKKDGGILSGVSTNVFLLGLVSLITDASGEMIAPVLPLFLTFLGGGGILVGLVGGLGESVSSFVMALSGYYSDRNGRRVPFIFAGYFLAAASKIAFVFVTAPWQILILRPVERAGKGIRNPPRDAIISESQDDARGKAFGIHRAMDSMGAIIGSVMAFLIILLYLDAQNERSTFVLIFLVSGFIGFTALLPMLWVKDVRRAPRRIKLVPSIRSLPREFRAFLAVTTFFALGNFTNMFFVLRAQDYFMVSGRDPRWAIAFPILFYVWYNLSNAAFSVPVGMLSDRIGRKRVISAGYLTFAATCLGFAFLPSAYSFIALFALYGLSIAFVDGTQRALASELAPPHLKATALGTFHTVTALSTLPSSLIAGFLWETVDHEASFIYGAFMASTAAALILTSRIRIR